jgi:hypothetical protein
LTIQVADLDRIREGGRRQRITFKNRNFGENKNRKRGELVKEK